MGRLAFQNCEKLKTVIFADGFSGTINESAFLNCSSIKVFAIPSGTELVNCAIITRCQSLETIFIPNSVIRIGAYAFAENGNLKNFYFDGTKSQWKAVEKVYRWNYGIGNYKIYCIDDKISAR